METDLILVSMLTGVKYFEQHTDTRTHTFPLTPTIGVIIALREEKIVC